MSSADTPIYLFANWKMYLDYAESVALAQSLADASISPAIKMTVFPSALALPRVAEILNPSGLGVGAQNFYWLSKAGCTGEISALMFKSAGAAYALVGHSERRHLFKETNHEVRQKMEASLSDGLTPVLCVGETIAEKNAGQTAEVIEAQLRSAFTDLAYPSETELIVAYEPVWAIGSGQPCAPDVADQTCALIQRYLSGLLPNHPPRVLYGGSVRAANVGEFTAGKNINGVLVGGASTRMESWLEIIRAVESSIS